MFDLKKRFLKKKVHIISISNNIDVWGYVTSVDTCGRFKGTWGDYVANFYQDYISLND